MSNSLELGKALQIDHEEYFPIEHPLAPGMLYGAAGKRATVFQLRKQNQKFALKVFSPRFRDPGMVTITEKLLPFKNIAGLKVCERQVLTSNRNKSLLREYPDLSYAVIMPWIEGKTWSEYFITKQNISAQDSILIATSLAEILTEIEIKRLAHCDLSNANLIIQPDNHVELIDIEEMYGPGFLQPDQLLTCPPKTKPVTMRVTGINGGRNDEKAKLDTRRNHQEITRSGSAARTRENDRRSM